MKAKRTKSRRRRTRRRAPGSVAPRRRPRRKPPEQPAPRRSLVWRSWLVFFAVFASLEALVTRSPVAILEHMVEWTARATAYALWLLGAGGYLRGTTVYSDLLPVRIIDECTGVVPLLLFCAAVIAYPCRWRPKLMGILLGIPAILFCNLLRLVSLCFVGHWFPETFETAHLLVWQSLIVFLTIVVWILWTQIFVRPDAQSPA